MGAQRIRPAAFFLPTCSQHATTALPRLPCRTPPCCSLLCRGRAPFAALCTGRRDISVLAWPARPPSPALYVCVCVLGMVMFQCRPMCFLPSGRLPFAVRLFLLSVGLAIAFVFGFGCSCDSLLAQPPSRALCCSGLSSLHAPRTAHTHLTHHTNCTLTTHSPHTSYTPHTHPHHTTSTHHTQSSPPFPPLHSFLLTQVGDGIQSWLCLVDALCA